MNDHSPTFAKTAEEVSQTQPAKGAAAVFTVILALLSMVALAGGNPRALSFIDDATFLLMKYTWLGFSFAPIFGLAAWAMLRPQPLILRFAVPLLLLFLSQAAVFYGYVLNRAPQFFTFVDPLFLFVIACCCFGLVRMVFGWRLGPPSETDAKVQLWHLFMWTSILGLGFAVYGWYRNETEPVTIEYWLNRRLVELSVMGVAASFVSTACLAFASGGRGNGYYKWVLPASAAVFCLLIARFAMLAGVAAILAPAAFLIWIFVAYGSFGYDLRGESEDAVVCRRSSNNWTAIIGCVVLGIYGFGSFVFLADAREEQAQTLDLTLLWEERGVLPISFDSESLTGAHFKKECPISKEAVQAMEGQPLEKVSIHDHSPEVGALRQLAGIPSLKIISFKNASLNAAQLEELYGASQIESIFFRGVTTLTPADLVRMQEELPDDCEIR